MEIDPFSRNTPESSSEDKTDDDSSSKKKKKSKRLPLFNAPSESSEKTAESDKPTEEKKDDGAAEPLWRRVLGQPEADKDTSTEADVEEEKADDFETAEAAEEAEQQTPLESLSEAEQLEVAEAYIAARQAELLEEQTTAVEGEDEAAVQERAANIALLEAMRQLLARDRAEEQTATEPLEEAYDTTVHNLGFSEAVPRPAPEQTVAPEPETLPLSPAGTITLRPEQRQMNDAPETVSPPAPEYGTRTQTTETREEPTDQRRRTGSALLVGGLVGYFVGRRRGRITTENKFKAVETKLTKQIEQVQQTVMQKEQQIRRLAREAYEAKAVILAPAKAERVVPKIEKQPSLRTEQLGLVTLKAVEGPTRREAKIEPLTKAPKVEQLATPSQKIEALSRPELLAAAAEVKVGATNLRRVFETHLVSEVGLRRLLIEHERGGNVRETLEQEITEKEMSYERDPRLRNRAVMGSLAAGKVVRADIDRPEPTASAVSVQSNNTDEAPDAQRQHAMNAPKTPPAAVAAVATLVVVIAVLLVILFTSR